MRYVVALAILLGCATSFTSQPAEAAIAPLSVPAVKAKQEGVQKVWYYWHGRRWHHRRWARRAFVGGVWVPGHWAYY